MKKFHYVYLLENTKPIDERKYYIGVRSTDISPKNDNYFSSSKIIKKLIKENGNTFTKKIIKEFNNRKDALAYEIFMHEKQKVSTNHFFYNLTKQTNLGFDTTGFIFINGVRLPISNYYLSDEKYHTYGKITLKDKNNNKFYVSVNDDRYIKGELIGLSTGLTPIRNDDGCYIIINKSDYNKDIHKTSNHQKAPVVDKDGNRFLIDINDERYLSGKVKSVHKNKVICKDNNNNIHYIDRDEFLEKKYVGINKGNINGSQNPNAKLIKIYDENDNVKYICNGDFKKTCIENNLPFISLYKSFKNGGIKIYDTLRGKSEAIKRNNTKFIGWYAK